MRPTGRKKYKQFKSVSYGVQRIINWYPCMGTDIGSVCGYSFGVQSTVCLSQPMSGFISISSRKCNFYNNYLNIISPEVVYCTLWGYLQVTLCLRAGLDYKYKRSNKIDPVRLFNGVYFPLCRKQCASYMYNRVEVRNNGGWRGPGWKGISLSDLDFIFLVMGFIFITPLVLWLSFLLPLNKHTTWRFSSLDTTAN